jgi:hypothetical protein
MLLTIFLFAIPFTITVLLSWHRALGEFRKSALNPLLLVALIVFLAGADFASMAATGHGELAKFSLSTTNSNLLVHEVKYVILLLTTLSGVATAFYVAASVKRVDKPVARADTRVFATLLYLFALSGWIWSLLDLGVNFGSISDSVAVKLASTQALSLFVFSILLLPGLTYALPRQPLRVAVPLVLFSILVLLASGSRTRIVYVLVPFAFYLDRVRSLRLKRHQFVWGVAVVVFLSIVAVNYRAAIAYHRDISFNRLISTSEVLNSNDIAFAESNIALSHIRHSRLEGFFGEDFLGFALAPIPRSVVPIKPYSGSIQFTQSFDPFKYGQSGRGLVIGGINEIEYDYPYPIALLVMFLLGAAWAWGFVRAAASRSISGFVWSVGLYVMLYCFLKIDLQASGQIAWAFSLYWLIVESYRRIKSAPHTLPLRERGRRAPLVWNRHRPASAEASRVPEHSG